MKRVFSVLIVFSIMISTCFALSSCSTTEQDKPKTTAKPTAAISKAKVEKSVLEGKIDTVEYALGTDADTIIDKYTNATATQSDNNSDHDHGIPFYVNDTKDKYTSLMQGTAQYFYLKSDDRKRISVIACTDKAFNFSSNFTTIDEVIFSLGKADVRDVPAAEDLIYTFGAPPKPERLTYNFKEYRLDFIFDDAVLQAVMLTDTELYEDMGNTVTTTKKSDK